MPQAQESPAAFVWCPHCGVRLQQEECTAWGCPKCGCESVPCSPELDVTVEVNWHELRILGCFAERWAEHMRTLGSEADAVAAMKTVHAICSRLQHQWPSYTPLTLSGELGELPEKLAEGGVNVTLQTNVPSAPRLTAIGPGAVGFAKAKPG